MSTTADDVAAEEPYLVVRNHEEQYSIWRADTAVPAGWEVIGEPRPRPECLDRITELWVDMRPASLRRHMEAQEG